ncbi:MAG: DUF4340 domain-containing protein [Chitinophagales bacterium]
MKVKNIFFILVFILIAALSIYILWEQKQKNQVPDEKDFAVENPDELVKIFLADKSSGNTILLEKQENSSWLLNKKYRAMPEKIDVLISTLKNVQVNYPVPDSQWDMVVKDLATNAVKVELYKEKSHPFKTYFVGRAPANSHGAFMIMQVDGRTAKRPYVCHIPGYVAELKSRYFTDELDWRDLNIFRYQLGDIKEVSLYYPKDPAASFRIRQNEEQVVLMPYNDTLPEIKGEVNAALITEYLSFFKKLNAEGFAENYEKKDSILSNEPIAILEAKGKGGRSDKLKVFYMPLNKRSSMQYTPSGKDINRDLENYYALYNGEAFFTIQDFVFGKTFKRYEQFFVRPVQ